MIASSQYQAGTRLSFGMISSTGVLGVLRLSVQFHLEFGRGRRKLGRGNAGVLLAYTSHHTYYMIAITSDDFFTPFPGDIGADYDWSKCFISAFSVSAVGISKEALHLYSGMKYSYMKTFIVHLFFLFRGNYYVTQNFLSIQNHTMTYNVRMSFLLYQPIINPTYKSNHFFVI